jgi:hypothetical protein
VQKERLRAEEMFVLDDTGAVVEAPTPPPSATGADAPPPLKLSECAPLFMAVRPSCFIYARHAASDPSFLGV